MKSFLNLLTLSALFSCFGANARELSEYEIVFSSENENYFEIYIMSGDGSNLRQLTKQRSDMPDYDPRWTANGDEIAFQSYRHGGWRTWVMNDKGKQARRFNRYSSYEGKSQWSPRNNEVVFTSYRPAFNLFIADKEGKIMRQLTQNSGYKVQVDQAHWSPDGENLVYISNESGFYNLYHMDRFGRNKKRLTSGSANDYEPSYSPDGLQILFTSDRDGNFETYLLNLASGKQKRLTNNSFKKASKYMKSETHNISSPYLVPSSWSPDGDWIAFFCLQESDPEICVMRADGSSKKRLTHHIGHDGMPSWRIKTKANKR